MSLLVIGIGNPERGDDGVGLRILERLREKAPPEVRLVAMRGDMLALFDSWEGEDDVLLVDAMHSGAEKGCVKRFDAGQREIAKELGSFLSTHAFNLGEAIELARSLGRLPQRLVLYGVEVGDFGPGRGLSEEVGRAVEEVARRIEEEYPCMKRP